MNLFELTGQYLALMEMMEDPDTDPQAVADTLESIEGEIEDKADAYAAIRTELNGKINTIKGEVERLKKLSAVIENNVKRMEGSLELAMRATGKTKFKTALHSFGIVKNGGLAPLEVDEEDATKLPPEFQKITITADNKAIRDYLAAGNALKWARLGERGERLSIR